MKLLQSIQLTVDRHLYARGLFGVKPLCEPMIRYRRIYAPLGLDELKKIFRGSHAGLGNKLIETCVIIIPSNITGHNTLAKVVKHISYTCTFGCRYNAVQYDMLLHISLQWIRQNTNMSLNAPISRPKVQAMGCLLWGFLEKNWPCYNGTALYCPNRWAVGCLYYHVENSIGFNDSTTITKKWHIGDDASVTVCMTFELTLNIQ